MAFFDDLQSKVSGMGSNVSSKAKTLSIENEIRGLEKQKKEQFALIGEAYYSKVLETGETPDLCAEKIEEVKRLDGQIQAGRDKIQEIKDALLQAQEEAARAAKEKQPTWQPIDMPGRVNREAPTYVAADVRENAIAGVPCHMCGAIIEEDSVFCPSCGKKIEWPAAQVVEPEPEPVKMTKRCVACGQEISSDAMFCFACGAKQDQVPEQGENNNF